MYPYSTFGKDWGAGVREERGTRGSTWGKWSGGGGPALATSAGKGALVTVTGLPPVRGRAGRPPQSPEPPRHSPLARVRGGRGDAAPPAPRP